MSVELQSHTSDNLFMLGNSCEPRQQCNVALFAGRNSIKLMGVKWYVNY